MKKFITIVFVILILVGLCIWEQISINSYITEIKDQTKELISLTDGVTNIQTKEIIEKVEQLETSWEKHEKILCFFANHKDMKDLCVEIQKLSGNIEVNLYEDFITSLKVIYHLADDCYMIMGFSIQNIF